MPPRIRKKTSASASDSASTTPGTPANGAATPAKSPATSPVAGGSSAPASAAPQAPLVFPNMPPADANIPAPDPDFVPGNTADYRAALPRDAELRALSIAVKDITTFKNYAQVLGVTAPSYDQVLQALTVAYAWSSMRTKSAAWDGFSGAQEGLAWLVLRAIMTRLQPSFDLAAQGNTELASTYAGLAALLGAKKMIARKGASTRKANAKAAAEGKEPVHGRVGKARKTKAEKAAYAAAGGGSGATVAQGQPVGNPPGGATGAPAPAVPATASPAIVPAPAVSAGGVGANGVHS